MLSVRGLRVTFPGDGRAVRDVSLDVERGEVVAIVGESGSGKTVTALAILGLLPGADVEGHVEWKGSPMAPAEVRGREIAMVFQDPTSALNPVMSVGHQIAEVLRVHRGASKQAARARAVELLELVGIPEPARRAGAYPHEISGGMCQRVMLAMAMACDPDLLIADEPTTALDVTVQAQVLELLLGVKDEIDSAILLITHDLGVVAGVADRVLVMYAGAIVESGSVADVFSAPRHPYTIGLLKSLPQVDTPVAPIPGTPPLPSDLPPGCPFHPRCRFARVPGLCAEVEPPLRAVGAGWSACHFAEELTP